MAQDLRTCLASARPQFKSQSDKIYFLNHKINIETLQRMSTNQQEKQTAVGVENGQE
jgi:hypothetical protein